MEGIFKLSILLVLESAMLPQVTQAYYVLEVKAHIYRNNRHSYVGGDCCDPFCGVCDNQFIFCLRRSPTSNDGNPNNCPLGRHKTTYIESDSFTFSSPNFKGVPNPMTFSGSVWPVSGTCMSTSRS